MGRVLTELEHDKQNTQRRVLFNESYQVHFRIKTPDGFWVKKVERFYATTKSAHKYVEYKWRELHQHDSVSLDSIIYE